MEYLFILRLKGPLRFSMLGTRLSFKQFWLCLFLNGLRDVGCRAPFWKPCTFACVRARLYSICFRPSVALCYCSRWKGLHVSTSGWTVFLILRLTRDCIFFPGKAHSSTKTNNPSISFMYLVLQVVPGRAGGGSFKRKKNYIAKKEFAYRMCARWPTIAMSKFLFGFERSFCRCMAVMSWLAFKWCG